MGGIKNQITVLATYANSNEQERQMGLDTCRYYFIAVHGHVFVNFVISQGTGIITHCSGHVIVFAPCSYR